MKQQQQHKHKYPSLTLTITLIHAIIALHASTRICPTQAFTFSRNSGYFYKNPSQLRAIPEIFNALTDPFDDVGRQLFDSLDIGGAFSNEFSSKNLIIPESATNMVMESIGRDLLVFLTASVIVTPIAIAFGVSPILMYLIMGAGLGPHGLDMFANSKADLELGDFGILFLLFSEGLEVSSKRLQKLSNYLPLGLAQISLCTGILTAAILLGAPEFLERFLPLDAGLINVHNPSEALVLALAGTLSTSAFVFPVLKEREWEEENSGQAATSILLLQDLAVAPLLVLLPYVAGSGTTDYSAIAFLTFKATIGFGSVVYFGSFVLQKLFGLVAKARSTETFVALCLLVSAGMGEVAKNLGLTETAGAFAAGVLLANTNYRAQIQADILPFKGILLGIFFMDAGSSFDTELVLEEWPTIITGALALVTLKALTLFAATRVPKRFESNRLPVSDGIRLALLLSGGGEFAFVVLALAEKLNVLPNELGGVLTAIVLITMATTPFLGGLAEEVSKPFVVSNSEQIGAITVEGETASESIVAEDAIVVCGYGAIGQSLLQALDDEYGVKSQDNNNTNHLPRIVAFDFDPIHAENSIAPVPNTMVLYGDGANPEVIQNSGASNPAAIFVAYESHDLVLSCVARLRLAYRDTAIYARAQTRDEALSLQTAGASDVIVESDELPRSAVAFLRGTKSWMPSTANDRLQLSDQPLHIAAAAAAGMTAIEVDSVLDLFSCLKNERNNKVNVEDLVTLLQKSNSGIASDAEMEFMVSWIRSVVKQPVNAVEFCRIYALAPKMVQNALGDACLLI